MWWFRKKIKYGTGLIDDPRPIEQKERDWEALEIFTFQPVFWKEKKPEEWRRFPIFDQSTSGSCVAQSIAKLLGIENYLEEGKFVHYSARDIYTRRKNYPQPGMWFQDGMEIGHKFGATLEQLMPGQKLPEIEMNKFQDRKTIDEQMALIGKGGNYVWLPLDFDKIAQIITQGKGVIIGARFNSGQWNQAEVINTPNGEYGHAVVAVDFTLWKGEKALIFDNSWGNWGIRGQGIMRESQQAGMYDACYYYQDLKNTWQDELTPRPKPSYQFNRDLIFGMRNWDVGMLQECFQYLELFPVNVPSTGYYGNITARAVQDFIAKYFPEKAMLYNGKKVDATIRAKLNELFK